MASYSYARYLSSKKTVDDRALNRQVADRLRSALTPHPAPRILEIGAGLGTMVARMIDWQLVSRAEYVLLDADATSLQEACGWLSDWAQRQHHDTEAEPDGLRIRTKAGANVGVTMCHMDLEAYLDSAEARRQSVDLLVANAFLDLVDLPYFLPRLFELIVPEGLFWFTINFDGETIFQPEHPCDDALLAVYHRSMDQRVRNGRSAGDSQCGRRLFGHLRAAGAEILAAGASDWVVFAPQGRYIADEAYFLSSIVHTIHDELTGWSDVDQEALKEWVNLRMSQISAGDLTYIAHQLDFVGRTSPRASASSP